MKNILQLMAFATKFAPYAGILQAILDARGAFGASLHGHRKIVSVVDDAVNADGTHDVEAILANVRVQLEAGIIDRF